MEEADLYAPRGKPAEDFHDRQRPPAMRFGDEHRFEIGGEDVDAGLGRADAVADDAGEMIGVGDKACFAGGGTGELGKCCWHAADIGTGRRFGRNYFLKKVFPFELNLLKRLLT